MIAYTMNLTETEVIEYIYNNSNPISLFGEIIFTVLFAAIIAVAFIGNCCTCFVILREKTLQTASNYFIFNLAVCDLSFASFLPTVIYSIWNPSHYPSSAIICSLTFHSFLATTYLSMMTLLVYSIQRYIAITRPFKVCKMRKSRSFLVIVFMWMLSFLLSLPISLKTTVTDTKIRGCTFAVINTYTKVYTLTVTVVFIILPLVLIFLMNFNLCAKINSINCDSCTNSTHKKYCNHLKRKMNRTVCGIILTLIISWGPLVFLQLITFFPIHFFNIPHMRKNWYYISMTSILLCNLSTASNPFIYSLMSLKFRNAMKKTVFQMKYTKPKLSLKSVSTKQQEKETDIEVFSLKT